MSAGLHAIAGLAGSQRTSRASMHRLDGGGFPAYGRRERGLAPAFLREVSRHQIGLLASTFDALDLDPSAVSLDRDCPLDAMGLLGEVVRETAV